MASETDAGGNSDRWARSRMMMVKVSQMMIVMGKVLGSNASHFRCVHHCSLMGLLIRVGITRVQGLFKHLGKLRNVFIRRVRKQGQKF